MIIHRPATAAWTYHNGTKHSWESLRTNPHSLDCGELSLAFKIYSTLDPLPLPHEWPLVSLATLSAIAEASPDHNVECVPDLLTLAKLLFLSAGITKHQTHPDGERYFRAAACTGALYHIDLYLVCGELPDLSAGVYHFGPHDFALRCLRPGDYRHLLIQANGDEPAVARAPALLVCTSTYWRNAWKYQARTYRHWFWDAGTLLANTLAAGAALKLPIRVVAGFADAAVNHLLDLDPIIERFGNRAYRAAQLEAAIIGGKVYLAAYGRRLGATGLTFFDDDVKQFLAPHAAGKSVLFRRLGSLSRGGERYE